MEKFLGCSSICIDGDYLAFNKAEKPVRLNFSDLAKVELKENRLHLLCIDESRYELKLPGDTSKIFANISLLLEQYRRFETFKKKCTELDSTDLFAFFCECLDFSAKPYVWAVEILCSIAKLQQLSDIHFEPLKDSVKITFRKAGKVSNPGRISHEKYSRLVARIKFLAGCLSHISDRAQEGAFRDEATALDVRASTFPTDLGERLSLRFILPLHYDSLRSLGWNQQVIERWRSRLEQNSGLFIISGAVGSGKTTALYATLAEIVGSKEELRVVTLEDPVEGRIPAICQSSLDSMRGLSLAQAFKHLLRQDPDVIALGEIRDRESLKEALQAGLSGHKVLATFHAGNGSETLARLRQIAGDEYLVMSGLQAILHLELSHEAGKIMAKAELTEIAESKL